MNPKYEQLIRDILFEEQQIELVVSKIKGLKSDVTDPQCCSYSNVFNELL